jgi:hypothetical protein
MRESSYFVVSTCGKQHRVSTAAVSMIEHSFCYDLQKQREPDHQMIAKDHQMVQLPIAG